MRWLGAAFFFLVAVGLVVLAVAVLGSVSANSDTADGVVIGEGIVCLVLAGASTYGGFWVLRNWSRRLF
jgi:hypothetical protein